MKPANASSARQYAGCWGVAGGEIPLLLLSQELAWLDTAFELRWQVQCLADSVWLTGFEPATT